MYKILEEEKRPCGKRDVKYVKVLCTIHKETFWIKQNHFKSGSVGCCGCKVMATLGKANNLRHINELVKVNVNYIFCPNTGKWDYKCSVCGYEGSSYLDKLKLGRIGCRCSKNFRYTKEDREKQIQGLVDKEDNIVSFSLDVYNTTLDSSLSVICSAHGKYTCTVNNFVNHHSRCPDCAKDISSFGYYTEKKDIQDYLYLLKLESDSESFLKIGRSFKPEFRAKKIAKESGYNVTVDSLFSSNHEQVVMWENKLLKDFESVAYIPDRYFKGTTECFSLEGYEEIKVYAENLKLTLDNNPPFH